MFRLYFSFLFIFYSFSSFSQNIDPKKLELEIAKLNDEHKYDVAILKLNDIINDSKSTAYDRYNAYLQKYLT